MTKIYALYSTSNENEIRYIGKTVETLEKRLKRHLTHHIDDTYRSRWILKEIKNGNQIKIKLIAEVPDSEWEQWEIFYINKYKKDGYSLTNTAPGGKQPRLTKAILRKIAKQRKPMSKETKLKISKANKGKIFSYQHRLNIGKSSLGRKWSANSKKKISLQMKGKLNHFYKKQHTEESKILNRLNQPNRKEVWQYDLKGNFIKKYDSIREAERKTNIKGIFDVCKHRPKHKTAGGFVWRFKDDPFTLEYLNPALKLRKRVKQYSLNNELVGEYESTVQAQKATNIRSSNISLCCNKKLRTAGGFIWKFA